MRAILILLILCVACSTKQVNTQMYDIFSQDTIDYYKDGQWYKMTIPLIDTTHDSMQYKITQIVTDDSFIRYMRAVMIQYFRFLALF